TASRRSAATRRISARAWRISWRSESRISRGGDPCAAACRPGRHPRAARGKAMGSMAALLDPPSDPSFDAHARPGGAPLTRLRFPRRLDWDRHAGFEVFEETAE